jgi:hypothetical protein
MSRPAVVFLFLLALAGGSVTLAQVDPASESPVARFTAKPVRMPASYRARRHLVAENARFGATGWIDVVTEFQDGRLTYKVTGRGGSELVQNRVLIAALEGERDLWAKGPAHFAFSDANYRFDDAPADDSGLPRIRLTPRRQDERLIDGWLFLSPAGDVTQVSGRLAKSPSFWTKSVTLSQSYRTVGGVLLPVSVKSVAEVRMAGRSTFSMTYEYEMVDGVGVGPAKAGHHN